ncbi:MAG: hypothetical protein HY556_09950 [Euryarchaeota archaeon]|nr:hypothetical protein [Euryarchaeota archaeon]
MREKARIFTALALVAISIAGCITPGSNNGPVLRLHLLATEPGHFVNATGVAFPTPALQNVHQKWLANGGDEAEVETPYAEGLAVIKKLQDISPQPPWPGEGVVHIFYGREFFELSAHRPIL